MISVCDLRPYDVYSSSGKFGMIYLNHTEARCLPWLEGIGSVQYYHDDLYFDKSRSMYLFRSMSFSALEGEVMVYLVRGVDVSSECSAIVCGRIEDVIESSFRRIAI